MAPPAKKGKGCSIGCLVVIVIVGLLIAAAAFFGWRYYQARIAPWTEALGQITTVQPQSVCVNVEGSAATATGWSEVPCTGPHDAELYWAEIIGGDTHPGSASLSTTADDVCSERFASFVGSAPGTSGHTYQAAVPTEQSWANGDRDLICMVIAADGSPLTGSAQRG